MACTVYPLYIKEKMLFLNNGIFSNAVILKTNMLTYSLDLRCLFLFSKNITVVTSNITSFLSINPIQ